MTLSPSPVSVDIPCGCCLSLSLVPKVLRRTVHGRWKHLSLSVTLLVHCTSRPPICMTWSKQNCGKEAREHASLTISLIRLSVITQIKSCSSFSLIIRLWPPQLLPVWDLTTHHLSSSHFQSLHVHSSCKCISIFEASPLPNSCLYIILMTMLFLHNSCHAAQAKKKKKKKV